MLKAQLAAQQEELNALRKAVEDQGKLLALVLKTNASSPTERHRRPLQLMRIS